MVVNINYENDLRHNISDKMLRNLKKVAYKQDDYGMDKYGTPLSHMLNYDWEAMQDEEIADFLKYRECARQRKAYVIQLLKSATHQETVKELKEYIQTALEILEVEGTGK